MIQLEIFANQEILAPGIQWSTTVDHFFQWPLNFKTP